MKKLFSMVLLLCVVVSAAFCFAACDEKEKEDDRKEDINQVTILQIYDAVEAQQSNLPGLNDYHINIIDYASTSTLLLEELEIRNIDTDEFMLGYHFNFRSNSGDVKCNVYLLKFRFSDSAKNCFEKLGDSETLSSRKLNFKQYGNLVVGVTDDYYQQIFAIIDNI